MGIQSTQYIQRDEAIERIRRIHQLVVEKRYRDLEGIVSEPDMRLDEFVNDFTPLDIQNLDNWTNTMIATTLDEPFFRQSIFDNYIVFDEEDEL